MAESAVSTLLGKLASLLEQEVNLLRGLPGEVICLRDELEFMKAFLQDADAAQRVDGERNKVWIKKVRDIAFDTEDILDEFLLRLPYHNRRQQKRRWFRDLPKVIQKSKSVKAFHRIATKLQTVKSRVENISRVHQRYAGELENGSTSSFNQIQSSSMSSPELHSDGHLAGEAQLVGVEGPKQELCSSLLEQPDSKRIAVAVLGMGGLGKTTLANLVYNDADAKKHFEHRAWITVSQSFKPDDLLQDVIRQLSIGTKELPNSEEGYSSMGTDILKETIHRFLRDKRYLIVFDDVWRVASWNIIQSAFPRNDRCSRLMLTTRQVDVASNSIQSCGGIIYPLNALSAEASWTLFCQKAFPRNSCPENLKAICLKILQRCEGLPLAISAIGGMLAMKDSTSIDQFERVHQSLGAELVGNDNLNSVKKILSLSFDDLTGNLKSCLLYLAIFPKEYGIVKNKLIRLWIAESFVLKENGSRSSLEEVGKAYFNELLNRSLIQVSEKHDDGRIKACRIHDLIREIIMLKANEEHFAMIANIEKEGFSKRVRRLSVHKTLENVPEEIVYFSKLRSLLLFQVKEFVSNFSFSKFLKGSRLLQVLDCSYAPIDAFPKEITKLYNLRYLSLRGTGVKSIPPSILKLRYLQTLNLKDTGVEELPVEILQLSSLRHIHAYRSVQHGPSDVFTEIKGFKALKGIDKLTSLQSLCHMDVSEGGAEIFRSIGKLTQLRRLGILRLRRENGADLCSAIDKLSHLVTLDLTSLDAEDLTSPDGEGLTSLDRDKTLTLESLLTIPQHLQRLYMAGQMERLPHWTPRLLSLKSLVLRFSKLESDPLKSLEQLSNLVELRFYKAYDGKELHFKASCFPMLKILDIRNLGKLRTVVVESKAIPSVETLIFEDCKMLEGIPSGIENLDKLKQLELIDMDTELVKKIRKKDESEQDYVRVKHITSIKISSRCGEDGANENTYQYMSNISSSIRATNIIQNHDFSEGLAHWTANKCSGSVVAAKQPNSRYAVVYNRTETWQGLEQNITGQLSLESVYSVSAIVSVFSPVEETPKIEATLRLEFQGEEKEYVSVGSTSVSNGRWKELTGRISISPTTRPRKVIFYFEGPSIGREIRIRSVVIKEVSSCNIIRNPRFEDGLNNWSPRSKGCNIFISDCLGYGGYITPFSGERFARTENRKSSWNGIEQDITGRVGRKLAYEVTAVVRVFCSSNATESEVIATLYVKRTDGREDYIEFARVQATDSKWKRLQGKFLMIDDEPSSVVVYLEGPPPEVDILLDSLVIKRIYEGPPAPAIENPTFGVNIIENSHLNDGTTDDCPPAPAVENPTFGVNIIENSHLNDGTTEGWFGLGNCNLSVENGSPCALPPLAREALEPYNNEEAAFSSGCFLLSTNRSEDWMGPAQMLTNRLELFLTYQVSAWVKIGYGAKGPQTVSIKLEVVNEGQEVVGKSWVRGGEVEIEAKSDTWYEIAGSFRIEKQPARAMIYVFGPDPGIELMVGGLMVFPVDRRLRFEELKKKTNENRKCDVVLEFSGVNSSNSCITAVKVQQTKNSFPFGSCLYKSNLDNEDFQKFFREHFNWASFADELMWCHTEPEQGSFNYKDADEMLEFCQSKNIQVRGHCIFWEVNGDPDWISLLSKRKLSSAVKNRLKRFIQRYKGEVKDYNVFNEMLRGSFYKDSLEEEKRADLFKQAKKLDPIARLFANENNIDGGCGCHVESSPEKYVALVQDLKSKGAPIGGIGIQGRKKVPLGPIICSALDKLKSGLGLPIWYTELEVSSANEHVRADDLEVVIREAYAHGAVEGIVLRGFWELCMGENTENNSHLVNAEGKLNEAGERFLALKREFMSSEEGNVDGEGKFEFRGFPGTYSVQVITASETFSSTFDFERGKDSVKLTIPIQVLWSLR